MKKGHLSSYYNGIAWKLLSAVEAYPEASNQHEFNGVAGLKKIFGPDRQKFNTLFIFIGDDEDDTVISEGFVTWYDAREDHPTRSEYRLYFPTTPVSERASEGDLLVVGRTPEGLLHVIIAMEGTTFENQLKWLFGLPDDKTDLFSVKEIQDKDDPSLGFASRLILEELGIDVLERTDDFLEKMLEKFSGKFPTTSVFSAFARETMPEVSSLDDPDKTLIAWFERETTLFKTLECHFLKEQLKSGFGDDVDLFIKFSLSVQNRRKSRAGYALEHHLAQIFKDYGITYSRECVTENKAKPDFIFPSIKKYHDHSFPAARLTMLGAKSTCKDRWRQVLSEAARIPEKHLITLEPGISKPQTDEMQSNSLQLVLPSEIHNSYLPVQRAWLMDVTSFIDLVKDRD